MPLLTMAQADTTHLFLVGDCGEPYIEKQKLGAFLKQKIQDAGARSSLIFLGDNIYPRGLQNKGDKRNPLSEQILRMQLAWVDGLTNPVYFIPGNHDWAQGRKDGLQYVRNQQLYIDSIAPRNVQFFPKSGCPGPVEIPLSDGVMLLIIDTQWFLHSWEKPGTEDGCDFNSTGEVLAAIEDAFARHRDKTVVVAAHHPLVSYGEHGGYFSLRQHVFPLTDMNHHLYIPLPVLGSIYPAYRKWIGDIQDTPNPGYQEFADGIKLILKKYPGNFYVSGHDHTLQYIQLDSSHLIISGSGAKTGHVKRFDRSDRFTRSAQGFVHLAFTSESVSLKFFEVDDDVPEGRTIFEKKISVQQRTQSSASTERDFTNKTVKVRASSQYVAGNRRKKYLGENYRAEWSTEVEVPVFDLKTAQGGLKILQKGGGMQTLSLRLADSSGREFVLRSIEKFPERAVPEMFRKTFAQDLVQDQISAAHPYAALAIAPMAEALGLYHTNPKLVFVPDDPLLGIYQNQMANTLCLFEERPAGDWSDAAHFGFSEKIVSTDKVLEKLQKDGDNQVDQKFVLRNRLFDMIIGDWDRHDDQWRWASFDDKHGDVYRPIPRDRDQAFFVNEGKIPKWFGRKWALPKLEGFDEEISWPSGLSFNARYFDRSFLNELEEEDWKKVAQEVKHMLTDSVIDAALRQWPDAIYQLHAGRIATALKKRRDNIESYALSHYRFLSREVEVVGSDKDEWFEIERKDGGRTEVKIFRIGKDNQRGRKLFERDFLIDDTREIRLFGRGGSDRFTITGQSENNSIIRIIGGEGVDHIEDQSSVSGLSRKTVVYDQPDVVLNRGRELRREISESPAVHNYNRKSFQYDKLLPLVYLNYNPDDGPFVGGGFMQVKHGFRKNPWKSRHIFLGSAAPATLSFNFRYTGSFTEVVGRWNLDVDMNIKSPNYVNNFFGWGNESVFDRDIDNRPDVDEDRAINYYRYRFQEVSTSVLLTRRLGSRGFFQIGPLLQRVEVESPEELDDSRYILEYAASLDRPLFSQNAWFGGLQWQFKFEKRDKPVHTTRGVVFNASAKHLRAMSDAATDFSGYDGSLSFFQVLNLPAKPVFAFRTGGGFNRGAYEFYQAQILDGKTELRGYRKTRFYGDSRLYSNMEMRLKLFSYRSYMFPATVGLLAFYDVGRVWYEDENGVDPSAASGKSSLWHQGAGGGIWFTPFGLAVVSTEAGFSRDGMMVYVRLGYMF